MSRSPSQILPRGTATHPVQRQPTRKKSDVFSVFACVAVLSGCPSRNSQTTNAATARDSSQNQPANVAIPTPVAASDASVAAHSVATVDAGVMPSVGSSAVASGDGGASTGSTQSFLGMDESVIMHRLCDGQIARMQRNTGGSTISFRVWFTDGGKGLFKPQQSNSIANFRGEIAAYRMSRYLGLHRAPPSCGRMMPRADLQRVADSSGDVTFSQRVMSELLSRGDSVPGAMIFWVPGGLDNVPGVERYPELLDQTRPLAEEDRTLAGALSNLILFDFVNDNIDRWSGGNILRQRPSPAQPSPPLLYIDNGAAFSVGRDNMGARPGEQTTRLSRVHRVSRSLVARLRAMTDTDLSRELNLDPLGSPLPAASLAAVIARKDRVISHVDQLVTQNGESATYAFE